MTTDVLIAVMDLKDVLDDRNAVVQSMREFMDRPDLPERAKQELSEVQTSYFAESTTQQAYDATAKALGSAVLAMECMAGGIKETQSGGGTWQDYKIALLVGGPLVIVVAALSAVLAVGSAAASAMAATYRRIRYGHWSRLETLTTDELWNVRLRYFRDQAQMNEFNWIYHKAEERERHQRQQQQQQRGRRQRGGSDIVHTQQDVDPEKVRELDEWIECAVVLRQAAKAYKDRVDTLDTARRADM